jgi:branched-chain amino acid transport system permease protein
VLIVHQANADKVETFRLSINFLVAVVIGGTATVIGPLVGGILLVFVQNAISNTLPKHLSTDSTIGRVVANKGAGPAIFGILLILFVFALPDGLVGGSRRIWNNARQRRQRDSPPPSPIAPTATAPSATM